MKAFIVSTFLMATCHPLIAQEQQAARKWFSGIAVSETSSTLLQTLESNFTRTNITPPKPGNDSCPGCLKFEGIRKSCNLGLAVNPDSAGVEVNILKRVVYRNELKKKIEKKNYNGVIREFRFIYYFHDKDDAKNAYKSALADFTENLDKKATPVPAAYEMISYKGEKKIKSKYKGVTISYADLADDYVKDALYTGNNENHLYVLIIEREMDL